MNCVRRITNSLVAAVSKPTSAVVSFMISIVCMALLQEVAANFDVKEFNEKNTHRLADPNIATNFTRGVLCINRHRKHGDVVA